MDVSEPLRYTPLHDVHVALGGRMVPFAGFDMPVQYSGIIEEHLAVRQAAGLFDVSHMGEFFVRGPQAAAFVQHLVTNDVGRLYDGRAMYTVMCHPDGGIVDDLLVYRIDAETYMLVVNGSNVEKDFRWAVEHNTVGAELENVSDDVALLAIQGPKAFAIVEALVGMSLADLKYYHFTKLAPGSFFGSQRAILSHTGYTGEPGLEIYCDAGVAVEVWQALMKAGEAHGLRPAGLGARDTLRLEAGFPLYGNDLTDDTNPLEAGLGWVVKLDKGDFIGREALQAVVADGGPRRRLAGFVLEDRGVPRHGYPVVNEEGQEIGEVTSGSQSPILGQGIGLAYLSNEPRYVESGSSIGISIRGRALRARVKKPPFHKK